MRSDILSPSPQPVAVAKVISPQVVYPKHTFRNPAPKPKTAATLFFSQDVHTWLQRPNVTSDSPLNLYLDSGATDLYQIGEVELSPYPLYMCVAWTQHETSNINS